ncbi:MAG: InlB B-repeat-containing protein [Treponema sp.]|nr:InlB B-repeat-containing protein [Treponema sp.]
MRKLSFCVLSIMFTVLLIACNNGITGKVKNDPTAYATIRFEKPKTDRAAADNPFAPTYVSESLIEIVKFELSVLGVDSDGNTYETYFLNDGSSCMSWDDYDSFKNAELYLLPGTYNFELALYTNKIVCSSDLSSERLTLTGEIKGLELSADQVETLTFTTSYVSSGDLNITYKWPSDVRVGHVEMALFPCPDDSFPVAGCDYETIITETEEGEDGTYTTATYCIDDVPNGFYWLKIRLCDDDTAYDQIIAYQDIVYINGYKSEGSKILTSVSENQNYYIYYVTSSSTKFKDEDNISSQSDAPFRGKHNALSAVLLPEPELSGYRFMGWYLTEDYSDEAPITNIALGDEKLSQDITLYAKWQLESNYSFDFGEGYILSDDEKVTSISYDNKLIGSELDLKESEILNPGYMISSWDVTFKDSSSQEVLSKSMESLPEVYGTLTTSDGLEYTQVTSANFKANWEVLTTTLSSYLQTSDGEYVEDPNFKLSGLYTELPLTYDEYIELITMTSRGYVLNKEKSTYVVDESAGTLTVVNYYDIDESLPLVFYGETSEEEASDGSYVLNFYCDNTSGNGFYNVYNNKSTYLAGSELSTVISSFVSCGLAKIAVEGSSTNLYISEKYCTTTETSEDGDSVTYITSTKSENNYVDMRNYNSETEYKSGAVQKAAISGDTVTFDFSDSLSLSFDVLGLLSDSVNSNNFSSGIISISTKGLEEPIYQNSYDKLYFSLSTAEGGEIEETLTYEVNLIDNKGYTLDSVSSSSPSSTYLTLSTYGQSITLNNLPYSGKYKLDIKATREYGYDEKTIVSNKVIDFTASGFLFEVSDSTEQAIFTSEVSHAFANAYGLCDVKLTGSTSDTGSILSSFISAIEDFTSIYINLDAKELTCSADEKILSVETPLTSSRIISLALPDDITSFAKPVFSACSNLQTIELPAALTSLSVSYENATLNRPFLDCGKKFILSSENENFSLSQDGSMILSKNGSTVLLIAEGLTSLTVSDDSITSISSSVNTSGIKALTIDTSEVDVPSGIFADVTRLSFNNEQMSASDFVTTISVNYDGSAETVVGNAYNLLNEHSLTGLVFNGFAEIGDATFKDCQYLDSVNGVSIAFNGGGTIGAEAFRGASIYELVLKDVTTIGDKAFANAAAIGNRLTDLDLTAATSIGSMAFNCITTGENDSEIVDADPETPFFVSSVKVSATATIAEDAFASLITVTEVTEE